MYLELADNCNCAPNISNTLPVRDSMTGRIVFFNREALQELNNEELNEVIQEAPYLVQKIAEANKNPMTFEKSSSIVAETIGISRSMADCGPSPGIANKNFPSWMECQTLTSMPKTITYPFGKTVKTPSVVTTPPKTQGIDPKWSIDIEPSAKPWFARTEVLIGAGAIVLGSVYLLTRKK